MSLKIRASSILERPLRACIDKSTFGHRSRHAAILGDMPAFYQFKEKQAKLLEQYGNITPDMRQLYIEPLLTREQEYHLFRKYNFYKWQVLKRRKLFDFNNLKIADIDFCEKCLMGATTVRQQIVASNVRLVASIVKCHRWYLARPSPELLIEMVSDGNLGVYLAIDYFDYTKGNKFSTYGTYAIRDRLRKIVAKEAKQKELFLVSMDEVLHEQADREHKEDPGVLVQRLLKTLSDARTKTIVERYYGLRDGKRQKLKVIANDLGISGERVRQIRDQGLRMIREHLAGEIVDGTVV